MCQVGPRSSRSRIKSGMIRDQDDPVSRVRAGFLIVHSSGFLVKPGMTLSVPGMTRSWIPGQARNDTLLDSWSRIKSGMSRMTLF